MVKDKKSVIPEFNNKSYLGSIFRNESFRLPYKNLIMNIISNFR